MRAYLDACRDIAESQPIETAPHDAWRDCPRFWTIAQVVPWELRDAGDQFALRWIDGERPQTALECWFRRVVRKMPAHKEAPVEPWVVLYAMSHACAGSLAPSPTEYATVVNMPMRSRAYAKLVAIARRAAPRDWATQDWLAACNRQ